MFTHPCFLITKIYVNMFIKTIKYYCAKIRKKGNCMFSKNLIKLRSKSGWSQEKLANELGVSRQTIANWENNKKVPDSTNILKISQVFSVSVDDLLKEADILKSVQNGCDAVVNKKIYENFYKKLILISSLFITFFGTGLSLFILLSMSRVGVGDRLTPQLVILPLLVFLPQLIYLVSQAKYNKSLANPGFYTEIEINNSHRMRAIRLASAAGLVIGSLFAFSFTGDGGYFGFLDSSNVYGYNSVKSFIGLVFSLIMFWSGVSMIVSVFISKRIFIIKSK